MNTDELIALLAQRPGGVARNAIARRYRTAVIAGGCIAAVLMVLLLGLRPDLRTAVYQPMFWIKLALPVLLLGLALPIAARLARPGVSPGRLPMALAVPLLAVWMLAAIELAAAPPAARPGMILGESWRECPFNIALLSLPALVATFWVMRTLAPTRLARAGAASGLVAGTLAAAVYALHCDESTAAFLGIWYVAGMAIPVVAGALLGPRLLRW
jgi:hypothetical protein